MPIYEYQCECGRELEDLRKVSEVDRSCICPDCGKPMKRKISAHSGVRMGHSSDVTCCGRSEPCDTPSCTGEGCGFGD